jgi:hypothetical protein
MSVCAAYGLAATLTVNPLVDITAPSAGERITGAGDGDGVLLVVTVTDVLKKPATVHELTRTR